MPFLAPVDHSVVMLADAELRDWVDLPEITKAVPDLDVDAVEELLVALRGAPCTPGWRASGRSSTLGADPYGLGVADGGFSRFSVSPNPAGLLRSLPRYREQHPIEGEVGRMTLVGWSPGRSEQAAKAIVVGLATALLLGFVLWGIGVPVGIAGVIAVATPLMAFVLRRRLRPEETDELHLVALTDQRAIVLTSTWGGEPLVEEHPAEWILWAEVGSFRSVWLPNKAIPKVVLGDADGEVLTLELPNTDPAELEAILADAEVHSRPDWLEERDDGDAG